MCYLTSREYQGADLYPTLTGLNTRYIIIIIIIIIIITRYREAGDEDEWFRFRIMSPRFTQISEEGEVVSETCNHSRSNIEVS